MAGSDIISIAPFSVIDKSSAIAAPAAASLTKKKKKKRYL
jgi:hypothetical protein